MAVGRRCDIGCETWPDQMLYQRCLHCGEMTRRVSNAQPLPVEEALSMLLHEEFESYYEHYCYLRGQPAEGPLPEDAPCV